MYLGWTAVPRPSSFAMARLAKKITLERTRRLTRSGPSYCARPEGTRTVSNRVPMGFRPRGSSRASRTVMGTYIPAPPTCTMIDSPDEMDPNKKNHICVALPWSTVGPHNNPFPIKRHLGKKLVLSDILDLLAFCVAQ